MLRVGLTGGIGAGKSTVARRLGEHGAVLIDADMIAREVVEPGTEGLAAVVAAFGDGILTEQGTLDRPALARVAFADSESRHRLNAILHPRIGARTAELVAAAAPDAIVVHDIPLLVEGGMAAAYHLTVVVDAPEEIRVRRLVNRGLDATDARARIAAQATEAQRRAAADVWLDNRTSPEALLRKVDRLWANRLVPFEENVRLRREGPARASRIVPYDPSWPAQAERIIARVRLAAGDRALTVEHVGATAVPGSAAPDLIDVLLTVASPGDADALAEPLGEAGFPRVATTGRDEWRHAGADPCRPVTLRLRLTA